MIEGPVTVVVRRQVRAGAEPSYEARLEQLTAEVSHMPGYLGTLVEKPAIAGTPYLSVFRFDGLANLAAFEQSELRARFLAEIAPYVEADAIWERTTGLEVWFAAPKGTVVAQPSPHRMALVLIAVVFGLVLALNLLLGPLIGDWPVAQRLLITVILQVTLMTYVIMPRVTRVLARWIFPSTKTAL